jgi:RNA polymerase sigma factor (sigma-70 family)
MLRNKIIERHYRANFSRLTKLMARRLGGDKHLAEEAVQEAYTRALKYFKTFDPEVKEFDIWFNTILNNATSQLKAVELHRGVMKDNEDLEHIAEDGDKEAKAHWNQLKQKIAEDIDAIDNKTHAEVLRLHFHTGLVPSEICEIVEGVTREAAKKIIQRFRPFVLHKYGALA